jgi:hypothetical protein
MNPVTIIAPIDCKIRVHFPACGAVFESSLVADVIAVCVRLSLKRSSLSVFGEKILPRSRNYNGVTIGFELNFNVNAVGKSGYCEQHSWHWNFCVPARFYPTGTGVILFAGTGHGVEE